MIAAKRIKIIKGYTEEKLEYEVDLFLGASPFDWTVHTVFETIVSNQHCGWRAILVSYVKSG